MAKKPVRRKPTDALPEPLDALITALTGAGVDSATNDGGAALRELLTTLPYAASYFYPCPRFDHLDPDPLVPDQLFDVYFQADWTNLNYNVTVSDLTTGESYGSWGMFVPYGTPNPVAIRVPARAIPFDPPPAGGAVPQPIVVAGHDYAINVYATWGGMPLGCVATALTTTSNDALKTAVFKALSASAGLPFGTVPPALVKKNAPKAAKGAKKK